ncbi:hypothetical protein RFI_10104 [Reticulomyxa filosa]|uniref:KOW domain-containing protein n=1 Tax=Reticulomyxa filosa TaxID=46433 RepID=X6NLZ2_RETFI|nr:hypothetical protein RFI_10104 [Reticulomyxa filosa]|eukprot:ETO27026.1 hypothetical protein RFI_10104 [Reticulomyxa filosa]
MKFNSRSLFVSFFLFLCVCKEYGVPRLSIPIRKDDVVRVIRGKYKEESTPQKVVRVNRRKYRIYLEGIQREKANGLYFWASYKPLSFLFLKKTLFEIPKIKSSQVQVPIQCSNVVITQLKEDKYRKGLVKSLVKKKLKARKRLGLGEKEKKGSEETRGPNRFGLKKKYFFLQFLFF